MQITDIFGNTIEVTDLEQAIIRTEYDLELSKTNTILFQEYFFKNDIDAQGKPIRLKYCHENAKTVTNFLFYTHQLQQLKKLEK
jgi:hypothetical protein